MKAVTTIATSDAQTEKLMKKLLPSTWLRVAAIGFAITGTAHAQPTPADPLPSWNDAAPKRAIVDFVTRVTTQGGPDFVPPAERIATIDNDGTLWCEQPVYFQAFFVFDRVSQLAAKNPDAQGQRAVSCDPRE